MTMTMTIKIKAAEFKTAGQALQQVSASRQEVAITTHGRNYVTSRREAYRLAAAGVEFTYLCDHRMPDGSYRILTVPVN